MGFTRPRPKPKQADPASVTLSDEERELLAKNSEYVGSPHHTDVPKFGLNAAPRTGSMTIGDAEAVNALLHRSGSAAKIGTVAKSARQRRFRALAATYLAWTATDGEDRAATDATTRRQQASRAFAAEMVAPRQALVARADRHGFDDDDLIALAGEFVCPYETIKWQAHRAGIRLRGIELPRSSRAPILTAAVR
jgi:hypothetical protein